ncbi:MAG: phosphate ABC transporter substrate-binding protein [Verrucomicrobia bacterium]|jgi:phosphate transport system substrate-binding protein|nr:phosphate ABC transporter substrate-binding protein [Verrucomicrobiota bacterium]
MKTKLLVLLAAIMGGSLPFSASAGNITAKGSDTMVILAQKWAELYMQKNPDNKIQVTGGGSGTGFAALQNKTTDLANASRPIKPKEVSACIKAFGKRPTEYKVALDGLSVYVNNESAIGELTLDQLDGIFTGKIRNWKEVGGGDAPITIYSRENSSGTYEFFKEHVLKGKDFAASAQTMPGTAAVLQAVAKDKNGIGYGGAAYGEGAKHLKVKKDETSPGVEPIADNIANQSYPIWRYLYIYVNPDLDKAEIGAYLKWIRSDEGQKVVEQVGYFPLPKNWRSGS